MKNLPNWNLNLHLSFATQFSCLLNENWRLIIELDQKAKSIWTMEIIWGNLKKFKEAKKKIKAKQDKTEIKQNNKITYAWKGIKHKT